MVTQGYARPDLLVETEWLADRMDSPDVRIVDCDPHDVYRRAHIKGSVGIRVHHYIKHPDYATDPNSAPLVMPPEPFTDLMESMGIGDDTLVVAYDDSGSLYAARFWWVLEYYGHSNVKVLNGGWSKWFDEGRPVSLDRPRPTKASFTVQENPDVLCTLDHAVSSVGKPETMILDVRTDGEWDGTNTRGNKRAGHVPGAVHLEWLNFVTSDRPRVFKPAGELRTMLEERGITPEKEVITY